MTQKITKRRVDSALAGATIWDGELKGFGLRVSAKGVKSYVLKYRQHSQQRWYTIGRHGSPWTPDTARREAKRLCGIVESGGDPARDKAEDRSAEMLRDFAERYVTEYAKLHKKPGTLREEARALNKHILPKLGGYRVRDIQRSDIAKFHAAEAKTPYAANRYLALLSHMLNVAEDWGLRPPNSNPCRRIKKYEERARERFLSPHELRKLGRALRVVDKAGVAPYQAAAIRLLLFTGARLSEILTLQWEFVDFEARLLRLPESKTGAKTIALPPPAIEVLVGLKRQKDNPFVICGANEGAHLVNLQKPWQRLRKAAGLTDCRLHDLRHSFASAGAAAGMSLPLIGSLLGHSQPQTTARYAHFSDDPRHVAAETVAATISAGLAGSTGSVLKFRTARAS